MEVRGFLFWHVVYRANGRPAYAEHVPCYVHTYFIRCAAAEYAIPKPDENLTRLSPLEWESGLWDYVKLPLNSLHTGQDRQCSIAGGTSLLLAKQKCPKTTVSSCGVKLQEVLSGLKKERLKYWRYTRTSVAFLNIIFLLSSWGVAMIVHINAMDT